VADVSMERLREMADSCDLCAIAWRCPDSEGQTLCRPNLDESESMAAELIRLRKMIGTPLNFRADLKPGRVVLDVPYGEFRRCRGLLEAPQ
jgi:hypothetical protein